MWPKGVESESLVSHIDLLPTLIDLFNIKSKKKFKLPGKSYKKILMDPNASIQQFIAYEYDDLWATFSLSNPPMINLLSNQPDFPQTNVSNGAFPGPSNTWAMITPTHLVSINHDRQVFSQPETNSCYDNTPEVDLTCFRTINLFLNLNLLSNYPMCREEIMMLRRASLSK